MTIKINVHSMAPTDAVGLQLFDYFYAWLQSQHAEDNYQIDTEIKFSDGIEPGYFNILFSYMPELPLSNIDKYDLVILDNADEQLEVSTQVIYDTINAHQHACLLSNTYLTKDHPLYGRVIPTILDCYKFRQYNLMPFYPQYYDLKTASHQSRKPMTFINGANRVARWHFRQALAECLPEVAVRSEMTLNDKIVEMGESFFESAEDTEFRTWLNSYYPVVSLEEGTKSYLYHGRSVWLGIDKKFGILPPGYFLIDDYFDYHVVIYPESGWINDQLNATEKVIKCCYTKSFPAPLGGSNINQLYNSIGFYTAWNLLPPEHQTFDSNKNHKERYEQMALAMKWLHDHPEVFKMQQAQDMLESNYIHALTWKSTLPAVETFWKIIKSKL
jgi:hypothetical protein